MIIILSGMMFIGTGIIAWIYGYDYGKDYGYRKGWDDCMNEAGKIFTELEEKSKEHNHE